MVDKIISPPTAQDQIDKINEIIDNLGGSSVDTAMLSYYGTCATGASTKAKVVVCEGFVLKTGVSIRVKFTNNQTYNGQPTLNVNSTGAINITNVGTNEAEKYCWKAGEVVSFTYDGTNWIMEDAGIATTSYYGYTKLTTSATSTNTTTSLTPQSLNQLVLQMIEPYPVYSSSATYAVGDRVRYSYEAWECTTAITTAEAWTEAHWQALDPIQTQIDNLKSGTSYTGTCPAITPVDGVATWTVTHNLGSQAVVTALYSNNNKIEHNTLITSNNALTITFNASSAVSAGSYKIVVLAIGGTSGGGVDADLSNLSDIGKSAIVHNAMPSATYEDLTLGASGASYEAPADGWIFLYGSMESGHDRGYGILSNGTTGYRVMSTMVWLNYGNIICWLPVNKGDNFKVYYQYYVNDTFRFYYANGNESEAS